MYLFKKRYWFSKFRWTHHLYMSYRSVHPNFFFFFFFFFKNKKGDSHVTFIVSHLTVQLGKSLGKSMGTTSSNWSLKTPNPHTLQALLVSETSRNCNYSSHENSNLGCSENLTNHLPIVPHLLMVGPSKFQMWKLKTKMVRLFGTCV